MRFSKKKPLYQILSISTQVAIILILLKKHYKITKLRYLIQSK